MTALRKEREAKGWSQEKLGRRLGCTAQTIWLWESGRVTKYGLESLRAWAAVFDIEILSRRRPRTRSK